MQMDVGFVPPENRQQRANSLQVRSFHRALDLASHARGRWFEPAVPIPKVAVAGLACDTVQRGA
jgi:hypothetical protein